MIKYIVTWVLLKTIPAPCPDASRVDEFGRKVNSYVSCAVFHSTTEKIPMKKEFNDRKEAFGFYEKALKDNGASFLFTEGISDVKIDSVKIK